MNNVLQNKFSEREFTEYISAYVPDFQPTDSRVEARRGFSGVKQIGESPKLDLVVFAVTPEASIHARMEISKQSYTLLKTHPRAHAIIAYHSVDHDEWRLSLITTQVTRDKKGVKETVSNPRRYSYVLGPEAKVNTPTRYLITKGKIADLNDLKERFSLEVVNKDFYREISNLFTKLTGGTYTNGKNKKEYEAMLQLPSIPAGDQRNLEFAVRLIGRVIFCWFLREKKSPADKALMPKELLSHDAIDRNHDYYHTILEPIFFEVLNKQMRSRKDRYAEQPFSSIPYLNGGLFSPEYDDYFSYNEDKQAINHNIVIVPDDWIKEFFSFLETYNFTIDENVSFDEELSVDPEMLGRIFENLLAEINPETGESARKSTGSYYTPRSIVDYMVDESLLGYLRQNTRVENTKLEAIVSYDLEDDRHVTLSENDYEEVVHALSIIKILDPACGSGAFPIGIVQKIVFILQQVDPDGRKWFEKQLSNTAPEIKRVLEREFANRNFNYIRKLGVIRENVFGVDIQPIATEISRLRCFLTLIVDQSIHDELENRGVEPLPNLDFKFVTANTLIPLPGRSTDNLFKDVERINQLKDVRNQFFSSTNSERNQLKLEFKELQNQMLDRMIEMRGSDEVTRTLSRWDPFSHKVTPWFDPEWMFGVREGFDIVIANPPYISALEFSARHSREERDLLNEIYSSARGTYDLYVLFIEKAIRLLSQKGRIAFINPNKYLSAKYAQALRQFILDNGRLESLVDVSGINVFDEASVYPVLSFISKGSGEYPIKLLLPIIREANNFELHNYQVHQIASTALSLLPENIWGFLLSNKIETLTQALKGTKPLKEFGDISASSTAAESDEYSNYISESASETTIKVVNTGLIDKFVSLWGKKQITSKGKRYLTPYIDLGKVNLRRREMYQSPKVIYAKLAKDCEALLDSKGEYAALNTNFFYNAPDEDTLKFIAAYSNSKAFMFFYEQFFGALRMAGGFYQFQAPQLRVIPCKLPDQKKLKEIVGYVDQVLSLQSGADETDEKEIGRYVEAIDTCIDELFGLEKTPVEEPNREQTLV